mmetsp:Transcript_33810/g.75292  ORF Transcript_33810/g.75292 Transcript_33810/m.75292 type:complete len:254 (-) Transcript_33810:24-785(-)
MEDSAELETLQKQATAERLRAEEELHQLQSSARKAEEAASARAAELRKVASELKQQLSAAERRAEDAEASVQRLTSKSTAQQGKDHSEGRVQQDLHASKSATWSDADSSDEQDGQSVQTVPLPPVEPRASVIGHTDDTDVCTENDSLLAGPEGETGMLQEKMRKLEKEKAELMKKLDGRPIIFQGGAEGDGHDVESQRDCIQTRSHPVYGPLLTVAENRLLAVTRSLLRNPYLLWAFYVQLLIAWVLALGTIL